MKPQQDRIQILLVGCGRMGRNHLRVICEDPRFELVGVVDPVLKKLPGDFDCKAPVFSSFRECRTAVTAGWDCVVVAAPTESHFGALMELIPDGKPILVEKPLGSTHQQCREILAFAAKHGTSVSVGHLERFNPAIRKIKDVIQSGWLGTPIHFSFTRVGGYPQQVAPGNNVLLDLAVHDLDIFRFVAGPAEVRSAINHSSWKPGILDTAEILVTTRSGVSASFHVNWITPTKIRTLRVTGTRGVCFVDYILQTCTLNGGNLIQQSPSDSFDFEKLLELYKTSDRIEFGVRREEPLKVQLDQFFRRIRGHESEICTAEEAAEAVALAEQAIHLGARA